MDGNGGKEDEGGEGVEAGRKRGGGWMAARSMTTTTFLYADFRADYSASGLLHVVTTSQPDVRRVSLSAVTLIL